ncbi:uncharacterized protein LOC105837050 [Monomorium pharaonis]|uniref:uncharacterized protein LOC105837050 n=1 Tax=Monomorium pharaonis TaxID=307658 RepID=UPI0017479ACD|nr:uncharacterized protein LOC105837050 [Monomorium pharaonis]
MRRPLTRHLSEGGGGGTVDGGGGDRRQRSIAKGGNDERPGGYTWASRDYSHHLSFGDLFKATPTSLADCRGRADPRAVTIYRLLRVVLNNWSDASRHLYHQLDRNRILVSKGYVTDYSLL